jgi:16S rRNA processing protein RimM
VDKEVLWIVIGKFGRVQGLNGLIRVVSFTEPKENIVNYHPWYANINNNIQPLKLLKIEKSNKFTLVQVDGYQEREQVSNLTNIEIMIKESQLPELAPEEYYWHDLVGMQVINKNGDELGIVAEIMETGANDVLIVSGEKRLLIPYVKDKYIINIDGDKRVITVNWDENF